MLSVHFLSFKILLICLEITEVSLLNNISIYPCVNQTVSYLGIGFIMITKGNIGDNIKGEYVNNYCILRMMIEAKHQNKGLGKLALKQLIEIIKSISVNESFIWISTEEKNAKAIHVYEMNGFKKTNDYCGEEIILKYELEKEYCINYVVPSHIERIGLIQKCQAFFHF